MADRTIRIAEEIKRVLSGIIATEIKDPRLSSMASVMKVSLTRDLKYAKAYISVYDSEEAKKESIEALNHAEGYIKRQVAQRVNMRIVPSFQFVLDDSIDASINIANILKELENEKNANGLSD